ncbi:cytochrome c biogenesis protein ResB [Citricoccus parietis]|uniref:Cytochrome c biogenesis protein ResB n=1 Tax=Citricoccus parietis TaxID=592307 RepID=A0ABV5G9G3_9MICC
MWVQLTSMRTALMLLLLLAVAAVPGSLFPQRPAGPGIVDDYISDNPAAGEWLDRFQMFDVYSSVWFSAIYLLLFVSLIGCVFPRAVKHAKALRSAPPRTPRLLSRLPEYGKVVLESTGPSPRDAVDQAAKILKKRGYRIQVRQEAEGNASVGAERGYVREIGNIVFHLSLIGVLAFMAAGSMLSYRGQKILVEGEGFANTLVAYDAFTPGSAFSEQKLNPFSMTLDSFEAEFDRESDTHYGQALDFTAVLGVRHGPGEPEQTTELKVNHPLDIDGVRVYLVGNGYAPEVTVRDGIGNIAFQGPVIGRAEDQVYTSLMVIKAPDSEPDQLGFVGFFLPTAYTGEDGVAISIDPELLNPELNLNSYYGDLGLDTGEPQNVYVLDTDTLTELNSRNLEAGGITLSPGESYELPEGKGSIAFDGVKRFVGLDIVYDPAKWGVGIFAVLAMLALGVSLFVRRRRVWVRGTTDPNGYTTVEYGLLARGESFGLREENVALRRQMERTWPVQAPKDADDAEGGPSTSDYKPPSGHDAHPVDIQAAMPAIHRPPESKPNTTENRPE